MKCRASVNRTSRARSTAVALRKRGALAGAVLPVVEPMERRVMLSFSASLSGLPTANTTSNYILNVTNTGSVSASIETFNFGPPDTYSNTVGPSPAPTNPQASGHTYSTTATETPSASVTPSGGSAFTIPLTLDAGFNSQSVSGKVVTNSYGNTGSGNSGVAMVIDPFLGGISGNDILVLAPYDVTGTSSEWAVTAFEADGAPDTSFGAANTPGTKVVSFDSGNDVPTGLAIDPGTRGNIDVVGNCATGWAAAQLSGSGSAVLWQDSGFVSSGAAEAVAVQDDGKLVVAGYQGTSMVAFRLNRDGTTDTGFGSSGKKTISFSNSVSSQGNAVIQEGSGGDDIIGGFSCECSSNGDDFALAALNVSDGSYDTHFGSQGRVTTNFGAVYGSTNSSDFLYGLAYDSTLSRIVAVGQTTYGGNRFGVAAYTSSGARDTSNFNSPRGLEGLTIGTNSVAYSVAVDSSSNIILAGTATGATNMSGTSNDFALERISKSGVADTAFGSSGVITTDFSNGSIFTSGYDVARGVAVDSDGTIVAAGRTGTGSAGGYLAVARYLSSNQITPTSGGMSPKVATLVGTQARLADVAAISGTPLRLAGPSPAGDSATAAAEILPGLLDRLLRHVRRR